MRCVDISHGIGWQNITPSLRWISTEVRACSLSPIAPWDLRGFKNAIFGPKFMVFEKWIYKAAEISRPL